jgi:hypothetical protein
MDNRAQSCSRFIDLCRLPPVFQSVAAGSSAAFLASAVSYSESSQELVRRYSLRPKEIEFYFLQLVTLCFTKKDQQSLQLFESLLFHCCKCSIHSALLSLFMAEGAIFKPIAGLLFKI